MELNIFDYSNYRDFLRDYYKHSKESNPNFSYRYFSQKAGCSSPNFLHLVIGGNRNLGKDYVPRFSSAMGLGKREQQFFDALVSFNQAKTPEAKRYYLELIHNLKRTRVGEPLEDGQYEFLSIWYYPVIREMVSLPHFEESATWIRARLSGKVTPGQINDAIASMLRLGLLKRNETGKLVQSDANLATDDEISHSASYSFHSQMLALAREILGSTPQDKREVSGITMAISQRQFNEIKSKVQEFENSVMQYLRDNPDVPDQVYHLGMNLLPITNTGSGGAK